MDKNLINSINEQLKTKIHEIWIPISSQNQNQLKKFKKLKVNFMNLIKNLMDSLIKYISIDIFMFQLFIFLLLFFVKIIEFCENCQVNEVNAYSSDFLYISECTVKIFLCKKCMRIIKKLKINYKIWYNNEFLEKWLEWFWFLNHW